jgi:hypothetical protein
LMSSAKLHDDISLVSRVSESGTHTHARRVFHLPEVLPLLSFFFFSPAAIGCPPPVLCPHDTQTLTHEIAALTSDTHLSVDQRL